MSQRAYFFLQTAVQLATAVFFISAGINHFRKPAFYQSIVPPQLPSPAILVAISGYCEIAGGVGLLIPRLRKWAAWGLLALLVAVYPANIYMAMHPEATPDLHVPAWALWARLPLQIPIMATVWFAGIARSRANPQS